jgi:hypothetical protein
MAAKQTKNAHLGNRLIREGGKLGRIAAPDAETAIKVAIEQFKIRSPDQQRRLARRAGCAQRVERAALFNSVEPMKK